MSTLPWPTDADEPVETRRDWRDTLSAASDLALLGIVTTIAALPLVTAGAAFASASAAVHEWCASERTPRLGTGLRRLRRGMLPGLAASLVGGLTAALLLLNVAAIARGVVPGGAPLLAVTGALVVLYAGFGGLVVVEVGRQGAGGWRAAARSAWRISAARPWAPAVIGGLVAIAAFLSLVLPVCAPIVVGYTLFGLHVVARRTSGLHTPRSPRS